ncbi:uncharacterized protein LOC133815070 [Humulus lupulus]|uniref:uncharacterized protein LOC133815070 n=1 Tax=Humulus lupulus TaxID=3486 RepID=UPI002B405014|nr:uncharacterized protein LOC133815070 [Humulus lupulus]
MADSAIWYASNHLEVLKSTWSFFTWTNNQEGVSRIYSKIDHVFINEVWAVDFPSSTAIFKWETSSDHCSCTISVLPIENLGIKPFRFYNFWTEHVHFKQLVLECWKQPMKGSGLKSIYLKTMRLKHKLNRFNMDQVGYIGVQFQKAKDEFQNALYYAQLYPNNMICQEEVKVATAKFRVQEKSYYSFLTQRSKIRWLNQGDMNTVFFFTYMKKHKEDNRIATFINEQGRVVDNYSEVVAHFLNPFQGIMGSPSLVSKGINSKIVDMGTKLNLDQQLLLLQPFTHKEIHDAMFSISSIKSPGPDGFGSAFYKVMWPDIGDEVCRAILQFFETSFIPEEVLNTSLSLVPKVDTPNRAVDFRPIACCSTLYKCVSKLLCSRLAKVLPILVHSNQGAFIQGRSIAHNVLICQDIIKNYRRSSISPRCAIKVDISKAYDTIDWRFIEDLLKALCFPSRFIGWIMTCISKTSYSLIMNGRIQGKFKGTKGLRQGDPISPFLFVLVVEYLTRSLQLAAQNSAFRFHPLCKNLKLISLYFADDLLIFCKGVLSLVKIIKSVLGEFSSVTGLQINESKSQVFYGGISASDRELILAELKLSEGVFPLKYLGVPMRPTKWKHEDCDVIIQKIKMRLHTWASRHLSFAGRMQLIHSVLFGLRNYWMSIFVLPQSIIKEIEKLSRGFLWGLNGNRCKIHMASWDKVCLPKAFEGLGFRNGQRWNHAILAKYVWAVSEKHDVLWVKWVNSVYLKGTDIWSYSLPPDTSWYWRKLCNIRGKFSREDIISAGLNGKFNSANIYMQSLNHAQAINSQLLTFDNLLRFKVPLESVMCPVCGVSEESHSHLFFTCSLSGKILELLADWLKISLWLVEFDRWRDWLSSRNNGLLSHIYNMLFAVVVYCIWRNRNCCIFYLYSRTASSIAAERTTQKPVLRSSSIERSSIKSTHDRVVVEDEGRDNPPEEVFADTVTDFSEVGEVLSRADCDGSKPGNHSGPRLGANVKEAKDFQELAKEKWANFQESFASHGGARLNFEEPLVRDGKLIA